MQLQLCFLVVILILLSSGLISGFKIVSRIPSFHVQTSNKHLVCTNTVRFGKYLTVLAAKSSKKKVFVEDEKTNPVLEMIVQVLMAVGLVVTIVKMALFFGKYFDSF